VMGDEKDTSILLDKESRSNFVKLGKKVVGKLLTQLKKRTMKKP